MSDPIPNPTDVSDTAAATPTPLGAAPSRAEEGERTTAVVWRAITPLGRSVGVAGLVAWALATQSGWQELRVLAASCLLALAVGLLMLLLGSTRLDVLLELGTKRVVAGDPATTRVEATNPGSRRMLPVRLEARIGKGVARVNVPALAPGSSHDELFVIPTRRRSIVPVGPVRSVQGDPLGLVRKEMRYTGTEDLFVHPRTTRVGPLTTGWMRDLEGETTNDRSPSDVAFHTLREYVVGDDRRHIHWRTTARQPDGKLMVREFVDTRRAHLGLLLSLRAADYASPDEFELAVSALGSLGLRAISDEQEVTGQVGRRHLPAFYASGFLDALSAIDLGDDEIDLSTMAAMARDRMAGASVAALVTGARADATDVRIASDRLGQTVRTVLIQADLGAESSVWVNGPVPVMTLGALEDLPRLVRAVAP